MKNKNNKYWISLCLFSLCPLCLCGSFAFAAAPVLSSIMPRGGQRGTEVVLTFGGGRLADAQEVMCYSPGFQVAKLDVKGRIQLAMKGSKEERSILVRDGTKIVAIAVLDSPKISDGEVEKIASQKNVLEAVLRGIPIKRRFAKNYAIVRNLVFNPRTPLDLSLTLVKNLLVNDLKNLSGNKEVSETVRKVALRMLKTKTEKR